MAISPVSALVPVDAREFSHDSPGCVCSFDLDGNVVEMNAAMADLLGYACEEAACMNLSQLLEPESWKSSREQIFAQLGGGGPQAVNLTAIARDGSRVKLAVVRRLLFERGRPVAIQDAGRVLPPDVAHHHSLENSGERTPFLPAGSDHLKVDESHGFAAQLKQLHRLSTTSYVTLKHALDDHLETGCRLLNLEAGLLLNVEGHNGIVQASHGAPQLKVGVLIPLRQTRAYTLTSRLRTVTASEPAPPGRGLRPEFETYIGTPVWLGSELFATLSFSAGFNGSARVFSPSDRELIELMARSIGRVVLEHRIQSERDRLQNLENNRNRVLDMVAENQNLDTILAEVVRLVEVQCPGALCSLLLLRDEVLTWAAAPGFPAEVLRILKPLHVLRDTDGLAAAEVARSTVFWEDVRNCPFWTDRAHFAAQLGIGSCRSAPITSADGVLLGMLAVHYQAGQPRDDTDSELLQAASRLAARALEQRGLTERLEFQARHDPLTGLPNRSYFMELLEGELLEAISRSGRLAVLFIDLDRFKPINDILGHAMGDRLLREVGQRLRRLLTEDDLAGRMGGDEFTIVLTRQPDEQTAVLACQEFLNAFRAPHQIDDNELFVTASIGVAIFPRHGQTVAELLRNADLAMYHAKNSGKNDVVVFRAKDHAASLERLRLENALRRALENQEFELLYQPVVSMNGKVDGLEALLTWRHPIYGSISPKQFIPIAEETGLIIDIGSWVIQRACVEAASWHKAGYRAARISVNVSALQFERGDFLETLAAALALSKLPPGRLELELTESYIMKDLPQAAARLTQIRNLGVSVAIDDFGTGYSSLSYLNKLPVDSLKIDQSFLRNLHEPEGSLAVIQSIVRMAHSMNLTVVAEGVETRAELDLVRVLGCDKVQGHVYGPALRREEMEALLSGNDSLRPLEP